MVSDIFINRVQLLFFLTPPCLGCPDNELFLQHANTWAQRSERLGIYAYTDKSMWEGLPRPIVRPMMDDIELFHSLGIPRYVAQSAAANWGQMGPLYWLTAKKLWGVHRPLDPLLHQWYQGFFGESAAPIAAFFQGLERAVAESGEHYNSDPRNEGPRLFSLDLLAQSRLLLRQAAEAARDEKITERVAATDRAFEYGASYLEFSHLYAQHGRTGDKAALQLAIKAAEGLSEMGGRRAREFRALLGNLHRELDTGFIWTAFGEEEELGGRKCWNSDETGPGDNSAGWATFSTIVPDRGIPHLLTMTVWGKSATFTPVICTRGEGAGYSAGGQWTSLVLAEGSFSGREQWDELTFRVEPEWFDPVGAKQRIGFGGSDSQIWLAGVSLAPAVRAAP